MDGFGTMGVEIEFSTVPVSSVRNVGIFTVHDASVETIIKSQRRGRHITFGGEIVSGVFTSYDKSYRWISRIMNTLVKLGEKDTTDRDSIHFHIGFPAKNIAFLKRALIWSINIDRHLFRLGGMGREHRGKINDFLYCRPLINPPVVRTRKGLGLVFSVKDIMEVKTARGFFTRYGDSYNINSRYVAQRYVGINFYSILAHGTLEFRHFNKSLNSLLVSSILEFLSKSVMKVVITPEKKLSELINFEDFLEFSEISDKKKELLMYYYTKSPEINYYSMKPILCHLEVRGRLPAYYSHTNYCTPKINPGDVITPKITDSHEQEYQRRIP